MKNYKMANKGMAFEREIEYANANYLEKGISNIQKISTPWKVIRDGKKIVHAFPEGKSTLDFRGTVIGGISVSFDAKESEDERGLPLKHIKEHQIEYMRTAIKLEEETFILCLMKKLDKRFFIKGNVVVEYYDIWRKNLGKRGFNFIPVQDMLEVKRKPGIALDYLEGLY